MGALGHWGPRVMGTSPQGELWVLLLPGSGGKQVPWHATPPEAKAVGPLDREEDPPTPRAKVNLYS